MAPLKGCAAPNGKKPPFLFLFYSFLVKLKALARAMQTLGRALQPFLPSTTRNFDADFHELEEITRRALGAVESEVSVH